MLITSCTRLRIWRAGQDLISSDGRIEFGSGSLCLTEGNSYQVYYIFIIITNQNISLCSHFQFISSHKYTKLATMKKLILLLICVVFAQCTTFVELLGMGDLLQGIAVSAPTLGPYNQSSTGYNIDPRINVFITQFRTRTEFCDYKCTSVFNFPCFLLFACNIQLRNFILMIILPFITLTFTGICCGKGFWSISCWLRYLTVFTGASFILWVIKRCREGAAVRKRKQIEKQRHQNELKKKVQHNQIEVEPPLPY